jgi:putative ABC transport system substrate-binding protein
MAKLNLTKFCFLILILSSSVANAAEKKLIYSVYWNGCENVCKGIKDYFATKPLDVEVLVREFVRDKEAFPLLVQEAKDVGADVVVTRGTSVTLGMVGQANEPVKEKYLQHTPVVFTLVSDPIQSNIIDSYDDTGRPNITGVRNRVPEAINIATIRNITPSFKRLGMIYNPLEPNSVAKMKEVESLQQQHDFELIAIALDIENDQASAHSLPEKMRSLKQQQVDFIYLGSSTFLKIHMHLYTQTAVDLKIPILSPYESLVRESQAYISIAANDYDVGLLAGQQIHKILNGEVKAGDLPVASISKFAYVINMHTAEKIELYPSLEMLKVAELVNKE